MRIKQVGEKMKVSDVTINKWIKKGQLNATRKPPEHGGHWYWDVSQEDIDQYLKQFNSDQ